MSTASNGIASGKSERIPSHDFHAWDKYDADNEAKRVDEDEKKKNGSSPIMSPKGIPIELSEKGTPHTHTHTHHKINKFLLV